MEWPALESDPEIFNNYFHSLGLESYWEFQEVYDMSVELPCSAIVLAYRKLDNRSMFDGAACHSNYFIKQVKKLDNACGLLAGLHGVFNSGADLVPGSVLWEIKERINGLSPEESAELLVGDAGSAEWADCQNRLKKTHSDFARQGQTMMTHKPKHHFIAIMPGVEVFDGGKTGPVKLMDSGFCLEFFSLVQEAIANNEIGPDINLMVLQNLAFI